MSTNLGMGWRKLSDHVVADRYHWRQMVDIEGLGAVYFEKAINGKYTASISVMRSDQYRSCYIDTHSELYIVRDVADVHQEPEIFDSTLGPFLRRTFVLEKEYMFVQVR